ncbi:MAG: DUF177 domain-containing protein [Acidobacteria bacterium]|nr:DUF177 domain-containing protein [Acidobacteriota bacterium]
MKIELAAAQPTPKEIEVSFPPESIDIAPDAEIIENVDFRGSMWRDSHGPHISGHFSTKVKVECSRCLIPVERSIVGEFDDLFEEEEKTVEQEFEVKAEMLDTSFADGSVDLAELLREQIVLDLPEQVFCREDCRGLCPKCGQDRNLIDCNCSADIDPRWAAFQDLN